MARLFGYICNQAERLMPALEPVRHVLVAEAPVLRWGLGYIQGNEVLLSRTPRRSDDSVDLYEPLQRLRSDNVIAHAAGDDGLYGNENTQPLRHRRWLFAQEGQERASAALGRLRPRLMEAIPEFLRRSIRGQTLAEQVFYTFLSVLHARSAIDNAGLSAADLRIALAQAVSRIEDISRAEGLSSPLGNLIASNGRFLIALRLDQPLSMRRLVLPGARPPSRKDTSFKGVLAVSTPAHPGAGFEEIPPRAALFLSRELELEVAALDA